jgi:hydroxyatrazine ethylaminohydrolase
MDWIGRIYEIFKLIDSDSIYYSSLTAMADLLKHGCTCAFDHQYCFPRAAGRDLVDRQMEAASLLGIRYHAGRGANTLPKGEGSAIPEEMLESTDEFLSDCERLIGLYHEAGPFAMRDIVVAPCQPINCRRDTFVESIALARDKGVRLHTHLGEGENAGMSARWGKRSLAWCEDIGFVGSDVWYAHGWELSPDEWKVLAATKTGISHCPAPAVLGGFPILDIPAMRKAGVRIGLGCDGSATNDSSNLLDSLRMAYLMQSYHGKERGASPSAYEMLKIATVGGADLLGRGDLGSLEVGKAADLFMIDAERLEFSGTSHDPANLLARVGVTGTVWLTMVNGRSVYADGTLVGIDEEKLVTEADAAYIRAIRDRSPAYGGAML